MDCLGWSLSACLAPASQMDGCLPTCCLQFFPCFPTPFTFHPLTSAHYSSLVTLLTFFFFFLGFFYVCFFFPDVQPAACMLEPLILPLAPPSLPLEATFHILSYKGLLSFQQIFPPSLPHICWGLECCGEEEQT